MGRTNRVKVPLRSALRLQSARRNGRKKGRCLQPAFEALENRILLSGLSLSATPGGPVVIGSGLNLTDSATLSGGTGPTGAITFTMIAPGGSTVDTESVTVNGNGTYSTPNGYLPTAAGTYQWNASYSGDSNNGAISDNNDPAEQETVQVQPTLVTTPNPTSAMLPAALNDSAVLSGGSNPTGSIAFTLVLK